MIGYFLCNKNLWKDSAKNSPFEIKDTKEINESCSTLRPNNVLIHIVCANVT